MFVDGGVRQGSREGAAGWFLVAAEGQVVREIAKGSIYYGAAVLSSFMAEARALEAGLEAVLGAISNVGGNSTKKIIPCLWEQRRGRS